MGCGGQTHWAFYLALACIDVEANFVGGCAPPVSHLKSLSIIHSVLSIIFTTQHPPPPPSVPPHTHTHTHMYTHIHIHTCTHAHIHTPIHTHINMSLRTPMPIPLLPTPHPPKTLPSPSGFCVPVHLPHLRCPPRLLHHPGSHGAHCPPPAHPILGWARGGGHAVRHGTFSRLPFRRACGG